MHPRFIGPAHSRSPTPIFDLFFTYRTQPLARPLPSSLLFSLLQTLSSNFCNYDLRAIFAVSIGFRNRCPAVADEWGTA